MSGLINAPPWGGITDGNANTRAKSLNSTQQLQGYFLGILVTVCVCVSRFKTLTHSRPRKSLSKINKVETKRLVVLSQLQLVKGQPPSREPIRLLHSFLDITQSNEMKVAAGNETPFTNWDEIFI